MIKQRGYNTAYKTRLDQIRREFRDAVYHDNPTLLREIEKDLFYLVRNILKEDAKQLTLWDYRIQSRKQKVLASVYRGFTLKGVQNIENWVFRKLLRVQVWYQNTYKCWMN